MAENKKRGRPRIDPEKKVTQTESNNAWKAKNKEYAKYLNYRSMARSFIRNLATDDDIEELKQLMAERESREQ